RGLRGRPCGALGHAGTNIRVEGGVDGELAGGRAARCFLLLLARIAAQHDGQRRPDAMRVASPRHDHGSFEVAHILNVPFDDSVSLVMREPGRPPEPPSPEPLRNGRGPRKEIGPSLSLAPGAGAPEPRLHIAG